MYCCIFFFIYFELGHTFGIPEEVVCIELSGWKLHTGSSIMIRKGEKRCWSLKFTGFKYFEYYLVVGIDMVCSTIGCNGITQT